MGEPPERVLPICTPEEAIVNVFLTHDTSK
jgi:hypothetical protein